MPSIPLPPPHPSELEGTPDLSLIMPAYNEEAIVGQSIRRTLMAFRGAGHKLQLIVIDNGSKDRTGEIIQEFVDAGQPVVKVRVDVNQGYGWGVQCGIPYATAPYVGFIPADSQVDAYEAVELFEEASASDEPVIAKVRRRFRMDGMARKVVSISFNLLFRILWPQIRSFDINGNPKILPRDVLNRLQLTSKDFFIDPELMVKAHYLGVRCIEYSVFARMRSRGLSHVNWKTTWDFFTGLLRYRVSRELAAWKRQRPMRMVPGQLAPTAPRD